MTALQSVPVKYKIRFSLLVAAGWRVSEENSGKREMCPTGSIIWKLKVPYGGILK